MLKLIYNVKCGFKNLYMTEKNLEEDLSSWIDCFNDMMVEHADEIRKTEPDYVPVPLNEEELYEMYKDDPEALLASIFDGLVEQIHESIVLEYSKTYFEHICHEDPTHSFVPGYFEMTDLRLVLDTSNRIIN